MESGVSNIRHRRLSIQAVGQNKKILFGIDARRMPKSVKQMIILDKIVKFDANSLYTICCG